MIGSPVQDRAAAVFARRWLAAWNARDLDGICGHYAPEVRFRSPYVALLGHSGDGTLTGREALRDYVADALGRVPDLRFRIERLPVGAGAVTIAYRNHRHQHVTETMVLTNGLVTDAVVCYEPAP